MTITREEKAAIVKADFLAFLQKHQLEYEVDSSPSCIEFSWAAIYPKDCQAETVLEFGSVIVGAWGHHTDTVESL